MLYHLLKRIVKCSIWNSKATNLWELTCTHENATQAQFVNYWNKTAVTRNNKHLYKLFSLFLHTLWIFYLRNYTHYTILQNNVIFSFYTYIILFSFLSKVSFINNNNVNLTTCTQCICIKNNGCINGRISK